MVTRPSRPVPATCDGSMPLSASSFAADGIGGAPVLAGGGGCAALGAVKRSPRLAWRSSRQRLAGSAARAGAAPRLAFGVDTAMTSPATTVAPSGLHDLGDDAGRRRRQFQHDLVGLDVDQVLIAGNGLADLLVPLQQRGLRNRFGQLRDLHFDQAICRVLREPSWAGGRVRTRRVIVGIGRGMAIADLRGAASRSGTRLRSLLWPSRGRAQRRFHEFLLLRVVLVVVADGRRRRRRPAGIGKLLGSLQRLWM